MLLTGEIKHIKEFDVQRFFDVEEETPESEFSRWGGECAEELNMEL